LRAKDGSVRHVVISSNAYFRDGKFVHSRCFTRDITERKTFEGFRAAAADRAERLVKITAAVADAVTEAEVFEALVDNVAPVVNASTAALWLLGEDRTVGLARSFGYRDTTKNSVARLSLDAPGSSPVLDAILRAEAVWIPSQEALLRAYPHLQGAVTPGRSYRVSCLPLIVHGRILGALALTMEEATESSEEEQGFLVLIAWYAGQALERLRLGSLASRRSL